MCSESKLSMILRQVSEIYRQVYGDDLVKVILYGSYARGDFEKDSDIDIVALVHGNRQELQDKLKTVWDVSCDLELQYETIVSPTVIPYDEYMKFKDDLPYYKNIALEGVSVVA